MKLTGNLYRQKIFQMIWQLIEWPLIVYHHSNSVMMIVYTDRSNQTLYNHVSLKPLPSDYDPSATTLPLPHTGSHDPKTHMTGQYILTCTE